MVLSIFRRATIGRKASWAGFAVVAGVLWVITSPLATPSVLADGNSITITAVVAPARIMVVDGHGTIQKIINNSTLLIAPIATTSTNRPLTITPLLLRQYSQIAAHYNLNRIGVAYSTPPSPSNSQHLAAFLAIVTSIFNYHVKLG